MAARNIPKYIYMGGVRRKVYTDDEAVAILKNNPRYGHFCARSMRTIKNTLAKNSPEFSQTLYHSGRGGEREWKYFTDASIEMLTENGICWDNNKHAYFVGKPITSLPVPRIERNEEQMDLIKSAMVEITDLKLRVAALENEPRGIFGRRKRKEKNHNA